MTKDASKFCLGPLQRKYYLADSSGKITLHNFEQGQILKKVNNIKQDYKEVDIFHQNVNLKYRTQGANDEEDSIIHMMFIQDIEKLIAVTAAGVIKIYCESNPETSFLERVE